MRRVSRVVLIAAAVHVAVLGSIAAAETTPIPPGILAGLLGDDGRPLPLDSEGLPARRLTDAELHRVMLYLSQFMDHASLRLAHCHAAGLPFGHFGWRDCIEQ